MTRIGFIGLGIMGRPMSKNLLKAGYELIVYNRSPKVVEELVEQGARAAASPEDVASQAEIVITMLPDSPHVEEVVLGQQGILAGGKPGLILIDMGSTAPETTKRIAAELAKKGMSMLDAPVSGGEPKAIDGTLTIMAGGNKDDFDKCYPLFMAMASCAVLCGEVGAGSVTKLANQVIVALNIAAMSEAFVLAAKAGVNPEAVYQAIRGGLAGSAVLDAKAPLVMERKFEPGGRINTHIKDLKNVLNTGHEVGAPLPLTASVLEMMYSLKAAGLGNADHGGLIRFYEKLAEIEIHR